MKLNLNRRVILLVGGTGSGKSYSVAKLIQLCKEQGHRIMVIDRDRGLEGAVGEVGADPEYVDYRLAKDWKTVLAAIADVMGDNPNYAPFGEGDWLVFEGLGKLWDLAQSDFSLNVYGADTGKHLEELRREAEAKIAAGQTGGKTPMQVRQASSAYSGFDGRLDWPTIKLRHNDSVFDRAIVGGEFNILSTANVVAQEGEAIDENPLAESKLRPDGEKGHAKRHSTIVWVRRDGDRFTWQTKMGRLGKDRGHTLFGATDMTKLGFVESYLSALGSDAPVA